MLMAMTIDALSLYKAHSWESSHVYEALPTNQSSVTSISSPPDIGQQLRTQKNEAITITARPP